MKRVNANFSGFYLLISRPCNILEKISMAKGMLLVINGINISLIS